MDFTKKITIPNSIFAQVIDDEMVLLDTQSENYFGLDSVATQMWQTLVENNDLENLKQNMLELYEVEERMLESDIEMFISNLIENKLINIG